MKKEQQELQLPAGLAVAIASDMLGQLQGIPTVTAQAMLDVVAAHMAAGLVRTNPAAELSGIVRKWKANPESFSASPGLHIAEARRKRAQQEAREAAARAAAPVQPQATPSRTPSDARRAAARAGVKSALDVLQPWRKETARND